MAKSKLEQAKKELVQILKNKYDGKISGLEAAQQKRTLRLKLEDDWKLSEDDMYSYEIFQSDIFSYGGRHEEERIKQLSKDYKLK